MGWSPPGSSVHGILQARPLEWAAIPFPRGSSWSRDWTQVSCIAGGFFAVWATSSQSHREAGTQQEVHLIPSVVMQQIEGRFPSAPLSHPEGKLKSWWESPAISHSKVNQLLPFGESHQSQSTSSPSRELVKSSVHQPGNQKLLGQAERSAIYNTKVDIRGYLIF